MHLRESDLDPVFLRDFLEQAHQKHDYPDDVTERMLTIRSQVWDNVDDFGWTGVFGRHNRDGELTSLVTTKPFKGLPYYVLSNLRSVSSDQKEISDLVREAVEAMESRGYWTFYLSRRQHPSDPGRCFLKRYLWFSRHYNLYAESYYDDPQFPLYETLRGGLQDQVIFKAVNRRRKVS